MIHDTYPHKIYHKNINKPLDFHLETVEVAKSNLDFDVSNNPNELHAQAGYSSMMKRYWINSPTYGKEHNNPAFSEIFEFINKCAEEYIDILKIDTSHISIEISNSFLNFQDTLSSALHDHQGALFSYTYYFHLAGSLPSLWFMDPAVHGPTSIWPWNILQYKQETGSMKKIDPDIGDLYIFPSYMMHGTNQLEPENLYQRWLFNGDFHIYSDSIPNFPNSG